MKAERADQQDAGSAALVVRDSIGILPVTSGAPPTNAPTTVPEVHASVGAAPSFGVDTRAVSNVGTPSGLGVSVDTPTAGPGKAAMLAMGTPVVLPRSSQSCGSSNLQETEPVDITKLSSKCHLGAAPELHPGTSVSVKSHQHAITAAPTYTAASPQASNRPGAEPASLCQEQSGGVPGTMTMLDGAI